MNGEKRAPGPVVWCANGGLANRLRALCGFVALARLQQRAFYLLWDTGPACGTPFQELFAAPKLEQISRSQIDELVTAEQAIVYTDGEWYDRVWEQYAKTTHSWEQFRDMAYSIAKELEPIPSIADEVRRFAANHSLEDAVGLHIRWTDNLTEYDSWESNVRCFRREHVSRLQGFERFLRETTRATGHRRVFLATDNPSIELTLARSFGGELVTFPKTYYRDHTWRFSFRLLGPYKQMRRTTSVREALIDLLLLSRCSVIAGTYFSSFGELASLLGTHEMVTIKGEGYETRSFIKTLAGAPAKERGESPSL